MQNIDIPAFETACTELARGTLWREGGASDLAVAKLAGEFLTLAASQAAELIVAGRDPNIATRAINYLAHTHVAPPGVDAKWWFNEMLTCLLELAAPSMFQAPESSAFLLDVQQGIVESSRPAEE